MYQIYRMERRKNGEYILVYTQSAPTLLEIDEAATKFAREGHSVVCFTAPDPEGAWKTFEQLVKENI